MACRRRLPLLRVLPERAVQGPDVELQAPGKLPREIQISEPELHRVTRCLAVSQGPERPEVEDRIGTTIAKVEQRGRGGPLDPLQGPQEVDLQRFVRRTEGSPGDGPNREVVVPGTPGLRARTLPPADLQELVPCQISACPNNRPQSPAQRSVIGDTRIPLCPVGDLVLRETELEHGRAPVERPASAPSGVRGVELSRCMRGFTAQRSVSHRTDRYR